MSRHHSRVSCICTIKNEVSTLPQLVAGILNQSLLPDELIIIDGGSSDGSAQMLEELQRKKLPFPFTYAVVSGNRSLGRNRAIELAQNKLIAITDAGCIPDQKWIEQLVLAYHQHNKPVIAGYAVGTPRSDFEEAVVPYALVMPSRVHADSFLPATRSMLMEKSVWKEMGGFDESLSLNEDYVFAQKLQATGVPIGFSREAIVYWMPRSSLQQFWHMIFNFARGDAQAGLRRGKMVIMFARYAVGVILVWLAYMSGGFVAALMALALGALLYAAWSVQKNIAYVQSGWYWLPILQVVSDVAVMAGSLRGMCDSSSQKIILTKMNEE